MGKRVIFTEKQIKMIAEAEESKMRDIDLEDTLAKQLGDDDSDRRVEYPNNDEEVIDVDNEEIDTHMDMDMDTEVESDSTIAMKDLKGAHELLEYLDKMEEAKSILSKVAAKEDDDKLKSRIYSHYEKAQKLVFELIKEFGIIH